MPPYRFKHMRTDRVDVYCPLCDMSVNGPEQFKEHVLGKRHRHRETGYCFVRMRNILSGTEYIVGGCRMHELANKISVRAQREHGMDFPPKVVMIPPEVCQLTFNRAWSRNAEIQDFCSVHEQ